ncbi:Outer membrane receptor proteins, mostly Fe transport [Pedobacter steynii]|uniref:Outer membrane receptor proteins, mostly Fe transport n=1 Tax=Pedobacter steynii TaxID=430522 RepID=A0A1G9QWQ8_9SPHI|nr:TonB-dependent receptor [Pedobacter steynii]NQX37961.1 TonB-dependent receptor [Pedobacter steynii]SDM15311.1 Outer membrane receptor proteins, mostly Fe transport [Pedobacter steynii]
MKILFYIMFLFPLTGFAQIFISGKVSDRNKMPIPFVNVLIKQDSLLIAQTTTDTLGNYRVKINKAVSHDLFFQDINFKRQRLSLLIAKDTIVNVELEEVSNKLNEVLISSRKNLIERKADKYVIDVANSVTAMGSDAFTLLGKTPGVRTSSREIGLVGKSGVMVTIDGKVLQLSGEDLVSFLKTIPSSDIAKIEVITNPSASYEAQGSSGVLNILTKKNSQEGYSATVNLSYKQHRYANFNENASVVFNKGGWSLNGGLSFASGTDLERNEIDTYYPGQTWYLQGTGIDKNHSFNSNLDIQYRISDQTQVNFSFSGANKKSDKKTNYTTNIFNINQHLDSISNGITALDRKNRQSLFGFQLNHRFNSDGKSLAVVTEWLDRGENRNQNLWSQNYLSSTENQLGSQSEARTENKAGLGVFTINTELKLPFDGYELSVGGKATFINLRNNSKIFEGLNGQYVFNAAQSPVSTYRENRQAVFSDLKKTFDKWKFQLGLRMEYTQTRGLSAAIQKTSFQKDYLQLFPSLSIGYSLNENNNFDLTYGRRIDRPGFRLLNPFRVYVNAYDYWEGNPFLRPSLTNNLSISHTFHHSFITTFSYSNTKDNFEQIAVFQPNNVVAHQALNYMNTSVYQLMLTKSIRTTGWLESNVQLQGFYKENLAKINSISDTKLKGWYFMINNQILFNEAKTISAELNFWYQSSNIELEAIYGKQYNLDLGLKFLLFKKDLSLGLNVSDVLKSNSQRFSTRVNAIRQNFYNYWEPRFFRWSLQYKFGNKKIKYDKPNRSNSEEDRR